MRTKDPSMKCRERTKNRRRCTWANVNCKRRKSRARGEWLYYKRGEKHDTEGGAQRGHLLEEPKAQKGHKKFVKKSA